MKIKNQDIVETDTHLMIRLKQPYWSAYKRYKWTDGVEGFGISNALISKARDKGKMIMISFPYGRYEITPEKADELGCHYGSFYMAIDGTYITVLPRDKCTKIKSRDDEQAKLVKEVFGI